MIWIRRLKFYQYKSRNVCTLNQLRQRNLIAQATDSKKLESILTSSTCVYTGFDPTAQSLHVGNLLALISLLHFQITGHDVIALLGGATASGKSLERIALDESVLSQNSNSIQHQLTHLFNNFERYANKRGFQCTKPIFLDNSKWLSKISLIDFISTIGRKCRLARDSVKGRMEGDGISFTEFTYQLLQAYDFWHLFSNHGCKIQIGGSDQWGNITAGLELIRKLSVENHPGQHVLELAHGITIPLVTTSSGEKFGKSEGNAIWL
ncbi:tyrosyl-tRNA synthetase, partial [Globomyces sp. JEL0801]